MYNQMGVYSQIPEKLRKEIFFFMHEGKIFCLGRWYLLTN